MPVSVCVQCNGRPVTAALSLTRRESFISSSLKRKLGLDGIRHRLFFEDELKKGLFSVETQVCLTVSSGTKQIAIAAAVADIERDLILGTDAMSRLGITLRIGDVPLPLPTKRPLSRDWVLGVFAEIERSMRAPQRGIPTCVKCGERGHLRLNCRLQALVLSPDADEDEVEETDTSPEPFGGSPPPRRRRRVQLLSSPSSSEGSAWESAHSGEESDFAPEEFLPPSPSAHDDEENEEEEGEEGEPEAEDFDDTSSGVSSEDGDLSDYRP